MAGQSRRSVDALQPVIPTGCFFGKQLWNSHRCGSMRIAFCSVFQTISFCLLQPRLYSPSAAYKPPVGDGWQEGRGCSAPCLEQGLQEHCWPLEQQGGAGAAFPSPGSSFAALGCCLRSVSRWSVPCFRAVGRCAASNCFLLSYLVTLCWFLASEVLYAVFLWVLPSRTLPGASAGKHQKFASNR